MTHVIVQSRQFQSKADADDASEVNALEIKLTTKGVTLLKASLASGKTTSFKLSLKDRFVPWSGALIYWSALGEFIYVTDIVSNPYREVMLRAQQSGSPVVEIGWGETAQDLVIVSFVPTIYAGEAKNFPYVGRAIDFIDAVMPGFADRRKPLIDARKALLSRMNPFDNLADLEKQVDLLSHLVIAMAKVIPEYELPSWFGQLESIMDKQSSLQFKTVEENLGNIDRTKTSIRESQRTFFKGRDGAV